MYFKEEKPLLKCFKFYLPPTSLSYTHTQFFLIMTQPSHPKLNAITSLCGTEEARLSHTFVCIYQNGDIFEKSKLFKIHLHLIAS